VIEMGIYHAAKAQYDEFGQAYHDKREDPSRSYFNTFVDVPAMAEVLQGAVGGKRVLDLGCGSGIFTGMLRDWGAEVKGIDASDTLVEIARREQTGIEFVSGDAAELPYSDAEFDLVSSNLVVHYFDDLNPLFSNVARVLAPGGQFVFSFHHPLMEVMGAELDDGAEGEFRMKAYFNNEPYEFGLVPGMKITAFHHSFEDVFGALAASGFSVELLKEPRPAAEARRYNKQAYDRITRYPSFCIIGARLRVDR
jgi:SAM-dependent methyltransferase